jgi:hypothetical protein
MIYLAIVIAAAVALIFFLRRSKRADKYAGWVSGDDYTSYQGVNIAAHVPVDMAVVAQKVRDGLALAFADARVLGYWYELEVGDYKISIVARDGFEHNVAYFGSDKLGGDSVPRDSVIIVPDGFEPDAVRHEAEHIILYWNDRTAYDATAVPGHEHPLLPKLIESRGLAG